jgi:hypothetical protein
MPSLLIILWPWIGRVENKEPSGWPKVTKKKNPQGGCVRACASFLRKRVTWFKVGWTLVRKLQGHVPVNTRNWRAIDKSTQARLAESFHSTAAELTWLDRTKRSNCCPARYHLNECREESATTRMCLALLRQYCQHQHKYQEWQNLDTTKLHHLWTGISPWLMNVFLLEEIDLEDVLYIHI